MSRKSLTVILGVFLLLLAIPITACAESWVALALNQTKGQFRYACGTGENLSTAQNNAMTAVGMPGAAIWFWRKGGCLALAKDSSNNAFGMSGGNSAQEAENEALDFCKKMGGWKRCKILTQKCSE